MAFNYVDDSGEKDVKCRSTSLFVKEKPSCKLYRSKFLFGCLECVSGYTLVPSYGWFIWAWFPKLRCIPNSEVIPGCIKYHKIFDDKCVECK